MLILIYCYGTEHFGLREGVDYFGGWESLEIALKKRNVLTIDTSWIIKDLCPTMLTEW